MTTWDLAPYASVLVAILATWGVRVASGRARRVATRKWAWRGIASLTALVASLAMVLAVGSFWYTHRSRPSPTSSRLFQGVDYLREIREIPRPMVIHVVKVDLHAEGIRFLVTPADRSSGRMLRARKTTDFLEEFGVQLAINANYYFPFRAGVLWDYYPKPGDPVTVCGIAASRGDLYSNERWGDGTLYLSKTNEATFDKPPAQIEHAIAGNGFLVRGGKPVRPFPDADLYPRAALGLDREARTMILLVVDGKQPNYSEGCTLEELAGILLDHGAHDAIRLDEGGSATLARRGADGRATLINSPINSRIPGFERPVANHLGIFATP